MYTYDIASLLLGSFGKYMRVYGIEQTEKNIFKLACDYGCIELIIKILNIGISDVYKQRLWLGCLKTIKFAYKNKIPKLLDYNETYIERGDLPALKFASQYERIHPTHIQIAASHGHQHIVDWLQ